MATKKQPTRKQLAARKKFVKMVRARARALRAEKRAMGSKATKRPIARRATRRRNTDHRDSAHPISVVHHFRAGPPGYESAWKRAERHGQQRLFKMNPKRKAAKGESVTVRRNGVMKKLYGAAAAAVLSKRAGGKKRGTLLANRKRRNGIFTRAAKAAISKRLTQPIRLRRRRNQATPADIAAMHQTFLGRPTEGHFEITAPQGTPKDVAVLGSLVCLKTEDEDFDFDKGEAYLGADGRGNLYVLGDTTPVETNTNFGPIEEIRYEAKKDHLNPFHWRKRKSRRNSSNVEYFHYFGEEDGVMPKLKSDGDGLLHISGGNYTVEAEGIIN